jgi:hypothetical protein
MFLGPVAAGGADGVFRGRAAVGQRQRRRRRRRWRVPVRDDARPLPSTPLVARQGKAARAVAVGPDGGATVAAGGTDGAVQLWAGGRDPGGQHPCRRGRRLRRRRRRRARRFPPPPRLGRRDRPPAGVAVRPGPGLGGRGRAGAVPVCFSGYGSATWSMVVARLIRHSPSAPHVIRLRAVDPCMTRTATQMHRAPARGECAGGGQGRVACRECSEHGGYHTAAFVPTAAASTSHGVK